MLLLLVHLTLILGPLVLLALFGLRLWRQVRGTKSAAMEIKEQTVTLQVKVSELAERVDAAEVTERLAARAG